MPKCNDCSYEWDSNIANWEFMGPNVYMITSRRLDFQMIRNIIEDANSRNIKEIAIDTSIPSTVSCNTCSLASHHSQLEGESLARKLSDEEGLNIYFLF